MAGAALLGREIWVVKVVGIAVVVVPVTILETVLVRVANVVDVTTGSRKDRLSSVAVGKVVSGSEE